MNKWVCRCLCLTLHLPPPYLSTLHSRPVAPLSLPILFPSYVIDGDTGVELSFVHVDTGASTILRGRHLGLKEALVNQCGGGGRGGVFTSSRHVPTTMSGGGGDALDAIDGALASPLEFLESLHVTLTARVDEGQGLGNGPPVRGGGTG